MNRYPILFTRKLPVFFHIPKNAGTYVSSTVWHMMHYYCYVKLWRFYDKSESLIKGSMKGLSIVNDKNLKMFQVYGYDHGSEPERYREDYSLNEFIDYYNNNPFELFAIIVESTGFSSYSSILNKLSGFNFVQFAILRDPFKRERSTFNYIKSDASNHERNARELKQKINYTSFNDYLNSYQVSDSWLVRLFINVDNNEELTDKHFELICRILDKFKLCDIKDTDNIINRVFMECYGININDIFPYIHTDQAEEYIQKNKNNISGSVKEEIDEDTLKKFKERAKYEYRIYNRYTKTTT